MHMAHGIGLLDRKNKEGSNGMGYMGGGCQQCGFCISLLSSMMISCPCFFFLVIPDPVIIIESCINALLVKTMA